ncbi:MAG: diaminopimelate dehydrogenase [Eubacteriales bacterium]|nr:diaminopimelate dehydrogenase [Eubacteriales bacterium]MDD3198242.1 diaminopimelate dehydrogenase [Eubacteriales bacterium]MDD3503292.1 diaminopimelate dehydrogenase [Eubacteriales bacterium]MDD4681806.1 diaminopimelate dehydrogenase [Eubacteriales bacterium]
MIRIGLAGYGNLGKGVEQAIKKCADMSLEAVFTRRDPSSLELASDTPAVSMSEISKWQDKIDVLILCGGSATDLPEQGPELASMFNTVDSFDTHARIPEYFESVNYKALEGDHLSLISCGWDPGLFSLSRVLFNSILPDGQDYTFWGKGVSQGHSDAIRRIPGVLDARQYTIPSEDAIKAASSKDRPQLTTREKHRRECYVAVEDGADKTLIEKTIVDMPNYFADYDTTVNFISLEELKSEHGGLPHGGFVIRNGETSENTTQVAQLSLKLDSNPEFTASVLTAYARAIYRMSQQGRRGAVTVFDIPVGLLSPMSAADLRKDYL